MAVPSRSTLSGRISLCMALSVGSHPRLFTFIRFADGDQVRRFADGDQRVLGGHGLYVSWHVFEDLPNDVIGGDRFGFRFKVKNEPVAQRGGRNGLNIIETDVKSALYERAD